ncbi:MULTISPECIES: APC family permease [Methanobacterium]|uniref:Amino acid transporter n=1 Tax=Methanobacterium bryantii TaxID=2161 RepID=A0A2A2H4C9_METBR|nr:MULTISPECIES: APC family permease [Methanobacterium]OEC84678.1 amino acid transporter [Methanobacterium sp. A39]PAV04269.1 amino acid transporter [Methanobacterium bryantii]
MPTKMLSLFDVINLVVGTIVGADIYIAAAFGAGLLGPASIIAWALAGVMAIIIALSFAECSSLIPRAGGPYVYAKDAFGDFIGFLSGWALLIASWSAIAVFPLAFVAYLQYFFPSMPFVAQTIIKIIFIVILTGINYIGVREAGRVNDILTTLKLAPIILFTLAGIIFFIFNPSQLISNFTPVAPLGFTGIGSALVLIFWAYVGFELVTVPSDEIYDSKRTIPKAIVLGMGIVALFYIITNFVIVGIVPWQQLSLSTAPLALAGYALLAGFGALFLTVGALFSISGSDEAGILSSSRIPYAMAGDGLLPKMFARKHQKYDTPYVALIVQGIITGAAAIFGTISSLIILSVFTLLFCYLVTCISVFPLRKRYGRSIKIPSIIPVLGILISIYMMTQCNLNQIIAGTIFIAIGIPIYWKYSPKEEIRSVIKEITSREVFLRKWIRAREVFLGYLLRRLAYLLRRVLG